MRTFWILGVNLGAHRWRWPVSASGPDNRPRSCFARANAFRESSSIWAAPVSQCRVGGADPAASRPGDVAVIDFVGGSSQLPDAEVNQIHAVST